MNRIDQNFLKLKLSGKVAFMPFLVAGDPNFKISLEIVRKILPYADLLELGFPYSDPLADGPVIQAADARALSSGMNIDRVFEFIRRIREISQVPITVLVYANLVLQRGLHQFYKAARKSGIDGILIPDLPFEEAKEFIAAAKKYQINQIFLVTHTTTKQRLNNILKYAQGYIYLVLVLGTTGVRKSFSPDVKVLIRRVKKSTKLPVSVGFGVASKEQIAGLVKFGADGVIMGSRLIKIIEEFREFKDLPQRVQKFVKTVLP
ncbi:MAG: tryptophan synthase subunit alpha [bacterium]|nr:tryptophan synthase subunit alpha [bacterium]